MKIGVILSLAAGPLLALAQNPGNWLAPHAGRPISSSWLDSVSLGWRPPAVKVLGTASRQPWSIYRDRVRILMPDHMSCLVSWYPDAMPIDRRKGTDPMPNGTKGVIIKGTKP